MVAFGAPFFTRKLSVDATGLGSFPAEMLQKRFGRSRVDPITFTLRDVSHKTIGKRHTQMLVIMAAAVSDFRAADAADQKIKKEGPGAEPPVIRLAATTDILMAVASQRAAGEGPRLVVGFAAETQNLLDNARSKLVRKGLDLIVANDVSAPDAGFSVDTNRVTLLAADGTLENLPLMGKSEVAERVVEWVAEKL